MTGYLGRTEIGEAALRALAAVRRANPDAAYACDPVIGDVGRGSYVAPGVAEFFRDRAVPAATIVTPNAYELEWLTGAPVTSLAEARDAVMALLARGPSVAVVTSLSLDDTPADRIDMIAGDRWGLWRIRNAEAPDRGQRRRRPVRRALLSPLAGASLDAGGAVADGVVGLRHCRGDACVGRARTRPRRGAGRARPPLEAVFRAEAVS